MVTKKKWFIVFSILLLLVSSFVVASRVFGYAWESDGSALTRAVGQPRGLGAQLQNITMMCWVYLDTTSEKGAFFGYGGDQNTQGGGLTLAVGNSSNGNGVGNNLWGEINGVVWWQMATSVGTGWNHLALVDRLGVQYGYLNGVFSSVIDSAITYETIGANNVYMGDHSNPTAGTRLTAGPRSSACKVFNIALSTSSISDEMNSFWPIDTNSLVLFWPADESGGGLDDPTQNYTTSTVTTAGVPTRGDGPPVTYGQ